MALRDFNATIGTPAAQAADTSATDGATSAYATSQRPPSEQRGVPVVRERLLKRTKSASTEIPEDNSSICAPC